jgi:nucleoside 2-deoxyribosyltransferase
MNRWDRDFEHVLFRIERLLTSDKPRSAISRELRHHLGWLQHVVMNRDPKRSIDSGMHEALHQLMRRANSARTTEDLKELIRDIRQYQYSTSSVMRAQELEQRLQDLEGQVKTAAEEAATIETGPEADVVTLESLNAKRVLFAIMPFAREFDDVWTGGIKRAATGTGLTPIRIDMITQSSEITDDIVAVIKAAEIVVVDVTNNNPNVMFEFGFALARQKRHAVISQSTEFLTFDIKNVRSIIYTNSWQGIEVLHKDLQSFIKAALTTKKAQRKKTKKKVSKSEK